MRIIVIGAVAAGTSAAAKARRNDEESEIVIYEKDQDISYSGCGMPYYIGGEVEDKEELTPRDPEFFKKKYNIDIHISHEVLELDTSTKTIRVKNLSNNEIFEDHYDRLVLATGAVSVMPPIEGIHQNHVFALRNIQDMLKITGFMDSNKPKSAIIIGSGFIGLELCENLKNIGIDITLIEMLDQVTPGLDADMATYVEEHLIEKDVKVMLSARVETILEDGVKLQNGQLVHGDMIIVATGVKPEVTLAKSGGIATGESGAIIVDQRMETNVTDVYACGDCIEQYHVVTGKPVFRPLGSTANKTGRIAGENISGGHLLFRGILGTGIFKVFDLAVAQTGLSEKEAKELGYSVVVSHNIKPSKPFYMGGKELVIKAIADKITGKLLGVQIIGEDGVDKRLDVFVIAITYGAKAEDLFHLDLGYAPPFSITKDPVMYTGMILDNAIHKERRLMTIEEFEKLKASGKPYKIIDARVPKQFEKKHVSGAINIPHENFRLHLKDLDKEIIIITYCNKGTTGNAVQNILMNHGFKEVYNISGGHKTAEKNIKKHKKN